MKSIQVHTLFTASAFLFLCHNSPLAAAVQAAENDTCASNRSSSGCSVIAQDGSDRTAEWVSQQGDDDDTSVVSCTNEAQCQTATISGCDVVHCQGYDACDETLILDTKVIIQCAHDDGMHACHRTEMLRTTDSSATTMPSKEEPESSTSSIGVQTQDRITINCMAEINTSDNSSVNSNVNNNLQREATTKNGWEMSSDTAAFYEYVYC
jgi:hypothetical protein